jgi:hypothetical protein
MQIQPTENKSVLHSHVLLMTSLLFEYLQNFLARNKPMYNLFFTHRSESSPFSSVPLTLRHVALFSEGVGKSKVSTAVASMSSSFLKILRAFFLSCLCYHTTKYIINSSLTFHGISVGRVPYADVDPHRLYTEVPPLWITDEKVTLHFKKKLKTLKQWEGIWQSGFGDLAKLGISDAEKNKIHYVSAEITVSKIFVYIKIFMWQCKIQPIFSSVLSAEEIIRRCFGDNKRCFC